MRAVPRLGELYPGIRLTTEKKAQKTLSQGIYPVDNIFFGILWLYSAYIIKITHINTRDIITGFIFVLRLQHYVYAQSLCTF